MNTRLYPHPFFAREGWPFIIGLGILTLLFYWLDWDLLTVIAALLFVFVCQFFRDPAREQPQDPSLVVSPVDGRVCKIQKVTNPETDEEALMISIFMNVFNVHSQKAPLSGVVEKVTYTAGAFVNADLDKASTENERNAVTIRLEDGRRITFTQVAGLVARRILCYCTVGQTLQRGERYGFIRFGSRVDVYLPVDSSPKVYIGQKVTGVMTPIASLPPLTLTAASETASTESTPAA